MLPIITAYDATSSDYSIESYTLGISGQEISGTYEATFTSTHQQGTGYTDNSLYEGIIGWLRNFTFAAPPTTPVTISPGGGGGGPGAITNKTIVECTTNQDCETGACWQNRCVKLFDIKILEFESPAKLGEYFQFTYFLKTMENISNDVIIEFWIENQQKIITSGKDTIYLGNLEEKTESAKLFIPTDIASGIYTLNIKVTYDGYHASSYRDIELIVKGEIVEIKQKTNLKFILLIILAIVITIGILITIIILIKFIIKLLKNHYANIKEINNQILPLTLCLAPHARQ